MRGEIFGAIIGYLISYLFQNELVRAKLGFVGYIQHIWDVLTAFSNRGGNEVALTAWICIIVCTILGACIENALVKKGLIEPWPKKREDKESDS